MRRVLVKIAALALLIIPAMAQAGTTTMFTWQVENGPEPSLLQDTGTGIRVRNNQGTTNGSYPDANRSKTFNFTVACSGTYFLSGLYCAGGNGSNSWYVHIRDGGGFVTDTAGHNDATGNDSAWSMAIGGCARNGTVNGENGGYGTRYWQLNANTNYSIVLRGREELALLYNLSLIRDDSQPVLCGTPTPTPAPTAVGTGTGLSGFYYDDIDLGGTPECRLDPTVDFNWGTGSPNDGGAVNALGSDDFSVSWVGEIEAPADGDYTFYFRSDDGARVYINGNLEINQWGDQSATEYATASYTLAAGERVSITIEYYERSTNAVAQLSWTGPGIPKTIIPQDRLFPAGCAEPTRIPTPDVTLTPTNTPVPYTSGLHAGGRLYGLEYIPFPAQTVGGNTFMDLADPVPTGPDNVNVPRNTARWRITFKGLTATAGTVITVETRIGNNSAALDAISGIWQSIDHPSAAGEKQLVMPERPQNVSKTYAWLDSAEVPYTERQDLMGDPRLNPYKDTLSIPSGQAFSGNYNWFFMDMGDNTYNPWPQYRPFVSQAQDTRYNNGPEVDVPRAFWLWRHGLQQSASIYTSMSGFSSYYIGTGGEIGGDSANALNGGVPINGGPWGGGGGDRNEITADMQLIRNEDSSYAEAWRSLPFMGELWPDKGYSNYWSSLAGGDDWGNLPHTNSSNSSLAFRRDRWSDCDSTTHGSLTGGAINYNFANPRRINAEAGCGSFFNGGFNNNGTASGNSFRHDYRNLTADILADGTEMGPNYQFALPAVYNATRPFDLRLGNNQPEWSRAPYNTSNERNLLDIFSSNNAAAATAKGYYSWPGSAGGNATSGRTSAAVRAYHPGSQKAAWIVVNGFDRAGTAGDQFLSKFAVLSCFRAFHDAGAPLTAPGGYTNYSNEVPGPDVAARVEPVPLVKIVRPGLKDNTKGTSTINLEWRQYYRRWDDQKYTPYYPDLVQPSDPTNDPFADPDDTNAWHSLPTTEISYNLKYSVDGGATWQMAADGSAAQPGVFDDAYAVTSTARKLYWEWDVSGLSTGNKRFRVECYRNNFAQHYAYHETTIYTSP